MSRAAIRAPVTLPTSASPLNEKRTVFFTMILHPLRGWIRVGNAYSSRKAAQGWLGFVRGFWRLRAKVASCTITMVDGKIDERSRRVLDTKFNLDAPEVP